MFAGGEPISSTRIRVALARGDVGHVRDLLGREYTVDGIVARGERVGRKIGYPTINLAPDNEIVPADGVYVDRIEIRSFGRLFDSVTNIGRRPTVYEDFATTGRRWIAARKRELIRGDRLGCRPTRGPAAGRGST